MMISSWTKETETKKLFLLLADASEVITKNQNQKLLSENCLDFKLSDS